MPNRTVTFTGTVSNIGTVSTTYRINLLALMVPADPLGSPLDLASSVSVVNLAPGATSALVSVVVSSPMVSGDVLTNIKATLDITAPVLTLGVATPITRAAYTEPTTLAGSFSGSISVAGRLAAGLIETRTGYRLVRATGGLLKPLVALGVAIGGVWAATRLGRR